MDEMLPTTMYSSTVLVYNFEVLYIFSADQLLLMTSDSIGDTETSGC